jgi:hypothetical protein
MMPPMSIQQTDRSTGHGFEQLIVQQSNQTTSLSAWQGVVCLAGYLSMLMLAVARASVRSRAVAFWSVGIAAGVCLLAIQFLSSLINAASSVPEGMWMEASVGLGPFLNVVSSIFLIAASLLAAGSEGAFRANPNQ